MSAGRRRPSRRAIARDAVAAVGALGVVALLTARHFGQGAPSPSSRVDLAELDPDPDDAVPALADALARLRAAGGGTLQLPPGRWTLRSSLRLDVPGVVVRGAGMRATRLVVPPDAAHTPVVITADGVAVERLTVEGSLATWDRGTAVGLPAGIRVAEGADDVALRDLVVEQAPGYGIGFQRAADLSAGVFDGFVLRDVSVVAAGSDGIDIKNYDAASPACPAATYVDDPPTPDACNGGRSFLRQVLVAGHGALFPERTADGLRKAAVDVRGQRLLQSIEVLGLTPGDLGVSFRPEAGGAPNGRGGRWSTLVGAFVAEQAAAEGELAPVAVMDPDVPGVVVDAVAQRTEGA